MHIVYKFSQGNMATECAYQHDCLW